MTVHILNQYLWPDSAPTAIYAEQLGLCLQQNGLEVKMVSGSGSYRMGTRPRPALVHHSLPVCEGKRGGIASTLREYQSVFLAFLRYIRNDVEKNDTVLCTTAPPQTIHLIDTIRGKTARGIYWMQDYYPDLLRGYISYPWWVRQMLAAHWARKLRKWDHVARIASNLDYNGPNSSVLRNWPTLDLGTPRPFEPKTACYFGNLGYGHCHKLFIKTCETLRADGYSITLVGDGPKVSKLPSWIRIIPSPDETNLIDLHWRAEIHLIAGDPKITGAIFPSKYWNSRATGRKIVASGLAGPMLAELNAANALTKMPSPEDWLPLFKGV